jgi:alkylation response protein AidB-like acyl-CoA dehydrogenase
MRWALEPEQEMFRDSLSGWIEKVATPPRVRGWLDSGDPTEFETALAEEGWLAVGTAEDSGGAGGGLLELAIAAETFARDAAPSSAWFASVLALPALDAKTAATVIEEGRFAALVVSADGPPDTSARFTVTGNRVTGTASAVLGADRAALLVIPTDAGLYLVDSSSATITPTALLDRSRTTATVTLEAAEATRLEADAATFLAEAALRAAVLTAADSLGASTRMLQLSVEYSKQRSQYGQLIGSFQAMKHAAATVLVAEEASRSIVYYAAASVDERLPDAALHAAAAKAQATRAGSDTADSTLTMHGAIGYTWEHDLQLLYKRAKLNVALFGAPAVWNERIAQALELSAA